MVKIVTLAGALTAGVLLLVPVRGQHLPAPGMAKAPPPPTPMMPAGQPLIGLTGGAVGGGGDQSASAPAPLGAPPAPAPDPATTGVKCEGRDLRTAVKKVKALEWHKSLDRARADAVKSDKPILWLQTLGDLSGYA